MGSYAECWLDNLYVGCSKNDFDSDLISLFRDGDKQVSTDVENLPAAIRPDPETLIEGNGSQLRYVYFRAPVDIVLDRLDVLGYTQRNAMRAFEEWTALERQCHERDDQPESLRPLYTRIARALGHMTPEKWVMTLRRIVHEGPSTVSFNDCRSDDLDTLLYAYMSSDIGWYGSPCLDTLVPLRLAMDAFPEQSELIYDITDLIDGGYVGADEDAVRALEEAQEIGGKIVVLTEGKSDARVLSLSLQHLYPHLADYYAFLDFDSHGMPGGVGQLQHYVRAFVAAGIINGVIALFDNDTAGKAAVRSLQSLDLPKNVVIRQLPQTSLLEKYPTLGPSGLVNLNISGMAASIELYFGREVLTADDGQLIPVQWTGFDSSLGQYQGEIIDKALVHRRFLAKLQQSTPGDEWSDMRAILSVLFSAFHDRDGARLVEDAVRYYR